MKKMFTVLASLLAVVAMTSAALAADTLENVKKKGVLVAGVKDSAPPFGFLDQKSGEIVGYEIDLMNVMAKKLGVRLELKPVSSANRMQELMEGNIDIIAATMSKTPDRGKFIDFSDTYLKTGQKFLVKTGTMKTLKDLEGKRIATARGSTSELMVRKVLPTAKITLFDTYIQAALALKRGDVDAVTTDGGILYGILAMAKEREKYEIPDIKISQEEYAFGVRKGDRKFLDFVNSSLNEMTLSGEGMKIFDKWLAFLKGTPPTPPPPPATGRAGGVVYRRTSTPFRFLVMAVKGEFRTGSDVLIYDTQGNPVSKGKVKSIYSDEIYVDSEEDKAQYVEMGYVVGLNVSPEEAKGIILSRQDVIKNVKEESKKETAQMQKEIAAEYKQEKEAREKYQEEMTKTKMQLDYQYDDSNNWHGGGGYYHTW